MRSIFDSICHMLTSTVLTIIFWNQLNILYDENVSLVLDIVNLLLAVITANWICLKLVNISSSINYLLEKKEDKR